MCMYVHGKFLEESIKSNFCFKNGSNGFGYAIYVTKSQYAISGFVNGIIWNSIVIDKGIIFDSHILFMFSS